MPPRTVERRMCLGLDTGHGYTRGFVPSGMDGYGYGSRLQTRIQPVYPTRRPAVFFKLTVFCFCGAGHRENKQTFTYYLADRSSSAHSFSPCFTTPLAQLYLRTVTVPEASAECNFNRGKKSSHRFNVYWDGAAQKKPNTTWYGEQNIICTEHYAGISTGLATRGCIEDPRVTVRVLDPTRTRVGDHYIKAVKPGPARHHAVGPAASEAPRSGPSGERQHHAVGLAASVRRRASGRGLGWKPQPSGPAPATCSKNR
ncbi:hypothetical protein DFH06DRAFT_1150932 [Mycena polygramma]|nr:hypothetical protein DFH06DRAFT_1150932 [Mycena polygramma]